MSRKKSMLNLCRPRRRESQLRRKNTKLKHSVRKESGCQFRNIKKLRLPFKEPRTVIPIRTAQNHYKRNTPLPLSKGSHKFMTPVTIPKRRLPYIYTCKHSPLRSPFRKRLRFTSPSPKKHIHHEATRNNTKVSKSLFQTKQITTENSDLESLKPLPTLDEETIDLKTDKEVSKMPFQFQAYCQSLDDNDFVSTQSLSKDDKYANCVKDIGAMLPEVLDEFSNSGIEPEILKHFCQEVVQKRFPMQNIAFLLWIEVVKWYHQETTSRMRYMDETKKFWKLGWRHFGGRFIRFMSGFKNTTQVVSGENDKGFCRPETSDVNFVVPSLDVLRAYQPYQNDGKGRNPGTFHDVINDVASALHDTSACLSFYGKKLKQGLTDRNGDVDLLGFEAKQTLKDRQNRYECNMNLVKEIIKYLEKQPHNTNMKDLNVNLKKCFRDALLYLINELSIDAQSIRLKKSKKEYAKDKFIERGGNEWRQGHFAFVISAIKAFLYDIDCYLKCYKDTLERICSHLAFINNAETIFVQGGNVNLDQQTNYIELVEEVDNVDISNQKDTRRVKQRSDEWFKLRKGAVVTGSTLFQALGLDSLKQQREYFDVTICGKEKAKVTEDVQGYMDYGTKNEINAIATLVGKVLPVLSPELVYREEGCIRTNLTDKGHHLIVSPDGSLSKGDETWSAIEFKCPVKQLHTDLPFRYFLQCQATMDALNVEEMYYLCWRPEVSSVFLVEKDSETYSEALNMIKEVYTKEHPKRPTKLSSEVCTLKEKIKLKSNLAQFLGEFPSAFASSDVTSVCQLLLRVSDAVDLFRTLSYLLKEGYQINREKATEAVVFLACDLDRIWSKNPFRWAPINWFPKGYSLNVNTMRRIMTHVQNECYQRGVHVPAICFDGQWHNIAVRSDENKPLTLLQLQKDVWKEAMDMQKSGIVKLFAGLNKTYFCLNHESRKICTNGNKRLPTTPAEGWQRKQETKGKNKDEDKKNETELEDIPLLEVIPEAVAEASLDENNENIEYANLLTHLSVDNEMARELSDVHVSTESLEDILTEEVMPASVVDEVIEIGTSLEEKRFQDSHDDEETNSNKETVKQKIDESDAIVLLALLKTDSLANKNGKWNEKTSSDILKACSSYECLKKMLDADLKVFVRFLRGKYTAIKARESDTKTKKLVVLSEMFGIHQHSDKANKPQRKVSLKKVKSLALLCRENVNSKIPKSVLNISYAEYVWEAKLQQWKSLSPIKDNVKIAGTEDPNFWFSIPEYSKDRHQLEVKCVDSTHLFTRLRRHSCKGTLDGISNTAWKRVAKDRKTFLSTVMIEDVIDPMSVSMARTHFGVTVENAMRENGDIQSAELCSDIRNWWMSEDDPGIAAIDRINLRKPLRNRLLSGIDFGKFPPKTMHIKGFPIQLWEALISNIDAKAQLYTLCRKGTYNVRAFSTMMGETFFSELTLQDSRGHGAVTCEDFSQFLGKAVEQMHTRLDSTRSFAYRTSAKTVYPLVEKGSNDNIVVDEQEEHVESDNFSITRIIPRNHYFDTEDRKRVKGKKKETTISRDRNAILKGTLGVRWEKARLNESKLLTTDRMGLSDDLLSIPEQL